MSAYTLPQEPRIERDGWRYLYTLVTNDKKRGKDYTDIYEWIGLD